MDFLGWMNFMLLRGEKLTLRSLVYSTLNVLDFKMVFCLTTSISSDKVESSWRDFLRRLVIKLRIFKSASFSMLIASGSCNTWWTIKNIRWINFRIVCHEIIINILPDFDIISQTVNNSLVDGALAFVVCKIRSS